VLIVHLKRFQYERGFYGLGHVRSKIEELVDCPRRGASGQAAARRRRFPTVEAPGRGTTRTHRCPPCLCLQGLDLSSFAMGPQAVPPIYDLFAVSDHSGGLGGGHYTARARNFLVRGGGATRVLASCFLGCSADVLSLGRTDAGTTSTTPPSRPAPPPRPWGLCVRPVLQAEAGRGASAPPALRRPLRLSLMAALWRTSDFLAPLGVQGRALRI